MSGTERSEGAGGWGAGAVGGGGGGVEGETLQKTVFLNTFTNTFYARVGGGGRGRGGASGDKERFAHPIVVAYV